MMAQEVVYQGRIIEVVRDVKKFGDTEKVFEFARRSPGTRLIIVKGEKVLLTKEFRTETNSWDYRLPGGKVFDTLDEYNNFLSKREDILPQAILGAKREAREEVGIEIEEISHFHTSVNGATVVWDLYYFVVTKHTDLSGQSLEAGEQIETAWYSFDEAWNLAISGAMQEDRSAAVLLRFLHARRSLEVS